MSVLRILRNLAILVILAVAVLTLTPRQAAARSPHHPKACVGQCSIRFHIPCSEGCTCHSSCYYCIGSCVGTPTP